MVFFMGGFQEEVFRNELAVVSHGLAPSQSSLGTEPCNNCKACESLLPSGGYLKGCWVMALDVTQCEPESCTWGTHLI